jgi:hypothetical protein
MTRAKHKSEIANLVQDEVGQVREILCTQVSYLESSPPVSVESAQANATGGCTEQE